MKKTKLIKNVDEGVWKKLKLYSVQNNVQMGEALGRIINDYFKDGE